MHLHFDVPLFNYTTPQGETQWFNPRHVSTVVKARKAGQDVLQVTVNTVTHTLYGPDIPRFWKLAYFVQS